MRRGRGFNLLEVMVAIAVVGTLVAFLTPLWPTSRATLHRAGEDAAAWQIGSSQMEISLAEDFDALADRSGSATRRTVVRGIERQTVFDYEVIVSDVPPDLKTILVNVRWNDGRQERRVRMESAVANPN